MNTRLGQPALWGTPQTNITKSPQPKVRVSVEAQRDNSVTRFCRNRTQKYQEVWQGADGQETDKFIMEVVPESSDLTSLREDLNICVESPKAMLGRLETELKGMKTIRETYPNRAKCVVAQLT